uniref:UmuC domain-containing protein n=1 Tax=Heterorhabditis bacteriophora TaxID=37862 RepID=A0A1I7XKH7_HETBA
MERLIGLIDMDCFYAQVEQRERPELWNLPVVVVQHARDSTPGGILAVSYEARPYGVKRGMMVPEALLKCPRLNVCFVPQGEYADKADIQKYRDASAEIFEVLNNIDEGIVVERASVDEAFLDMTAVIDRMVLDVGAEVLISKLLENVSSSFPTTHLADGNDQMEAVDHSVYDREKKINNGWMFLVEMT